VRNAGALILIALLVLAGTAAYLLFRPSSDFFGRVFDTAGQQAQVLINKELPVSDAKAAKPKGEARPARKAQKDGAPELELAASLHPPPEVSPVTPAPVFPFPIAANVPAGLARNKLLADFGKPSMRTTSVEQDRLMETFVYLQSDRSIVTFVLLRNARVISAHTANY